MASSIVNSSTISYLSSLTAQEAIAAFRGRMSVKPCSGDATDVACMPAGLRGGAELHQLRAVPGGERPHGGRRVARRPRHPAQRHAPAPCPQRPIIPVIAVMPVSVSLELLCPCLGGLPAGQRSSGHARVCALLATQRKPCNLHLLCRAGVLVAPQGTHWLSCTRFWWRHHQGCSTLDASARLVQGVYYNAAVPHDLPENCRAIKPSTQLMVSLHGYRHKCST